MKTTGSLFLSLLFAGAVSAQSIKQRMAEEYYRNLEYDKAAPLFDELSEKNLKRAEKGKSADWQMLRRAAYSHAYARHYEKAARRFGEFINRIIPNNEDLVAYFEVLRYLQRDAEAEDVLTRLSVSDPQNSLVNNFTDLSSITRKLSTDSADFTVKKLPFNKEAGDFGTAFYGNGLVYASARANNALNRKFGRDGSAFLNLYYTERDENGAGYKKGAERQAHKMMSRAHDGPVCYSADQQTAYLTRNRTEKDVKNGELVVLGLYIFEKNDNGKWGAAEAFPYNSKLYSIGHAAISPDDKTLYFVSDMPGGRGGTDIWKSTKTENGWGKPENLGPVINTPYDEMFPFIAKSGNLYFASKGHPGLGGLDVFSCRLENGNFRSPQNMGYPINSASDDFAYITADEEKTGYFSSDRGDFTDRLYQVDINRSIFELDGVVLLKNVENRPLAGALVTITHLSPGEKIRVVTDENGRFKASIDKESNYEIIAEKKGYTLVEKVYASTKGLRGAQIIHKTIYMTSDSLDFLEKWAVDLVVRVVDCETRQPIKNGAFIVRDEKDGAEKRLSTDENGELLLGKATDGYGSPDKELTEIIRNYSVQPALEGYIPAVKKLKYTIRGNEKRLVQEICIDAIRKQAIFEIENIYYDFDKSDLRPLSKVQLDKLFEFLTQNPTVKVELSSHADCRGTDAYNQALSQRRAQSCVNYLVDEKNIPLTRITAKGYGESKLVNRCREGVFCTEDEHQMNRRTEIKILDK
jgi:outer membrane protein OmpA-like peptidoglycan-associated protein